MIRHKINHQRQSCSLHARSQCFKLFKSLGRIIRKIGRHIEVIADRVRAAGNPLEEIWIVRRLPYLAVVCRGRLLENTSQPNVAVAIRFQPRQNRRRQVAEFTRAILDNRAVDLSRLVFVTKEAG